MSNPLKVVGKNESELRVANHIILFGGTDLHGERFTPETEVESAYTKTGRLYVDFEHGHKPEADGPGRHDVLGYVDWSTARMTEKGLWVERVLERRNQYMQAIEPLIEQGLFGTSSEAVPEEVEVDEGGNIRRWPLRRDTLTVNPAEPRMMVDNFLAAIKSIVDKQAVEPAKDIFTEHEWGQIYGRLHSLITTIGEYYNE